MPGKVIVLGAGFSGLSASASLAKYGFKVEILEKYSFPGGRSRRFDFDGFSFEMGPTWYSQPAILNQFLKQFNRSTDEFFKLLPLDPLFKVYYRDGSNLDIPSKIKDLYSLFEKIEKGSSKKLRRILNEFQGYSPLKTGEKELHSKDSVAGFFRNFIFGRFFMPVSFQHSFSSRIRSMFKDPGLIDLLEFPSIFQDAASPVTKWAQSSLLYSGLGSGTFYPKGGMYKIIETLEKICVENGVEITYNVDVDQLDVVKNRVLAAHSGHRNFYADYFVSSADYYHTDQKLLPENVRNYSADYWESRVLAPSAMVFYIALNKKIEGLRHHNMFLDSDMQKHIHEIYSSPRWPESPVFYVAARSVSDDSVAPAGCENLVAVIPVAPGLEDHGKVRDHYFNMIIERMENATGTPIRDYVAFHRSFAHTDFLIDYNSYNGNAYGMANSAHQHILRRPKYRNKHLPNLFYAGQMTLPGAGVPNSILRGQIIARQVFRDSDGHKS